jgi:leucyl-tRNA synthetase
MGWDAFGLPAEEYARKTGTHPRVTTQQNIATFKRQIQMLGFSYDWDREVDTTDPDYVRWTQWIFLQLYDTWYDTAARRGRPIAELPVPANVAAQGDDAVRRYQDQHRLAYQSEAPVNWCPEMGTVLANEEVTADGKSEIGGYPVIRTPLRQWLLRITAYADRLLDDLDQVDWPESIKKMQRDWIGRSEGAEVDFALADSTATIRVFTTRPDTLFGATYMVLSPEHALVNTITTATQKAAVTAYQEAAARKSEQDRIADTKTKTGVFTGAFAINPVNGERIPIWIADYVLATYGTGAIMAVPAHDVRDFAFAKQFDLDIRTVVRPSPEWLKATGSTLDNLTEAYVDDGAAMNSGEFDGLTTTEFKKRIIARLEQQGRGQGKVNFKLRDWLFSRQRYWGEPFPLLHELDDAGNPTGLIRPLTAADLPLRLPDLEDFKPTGSPEGPLVKAVDWVNVTIGGKKYRRETNTMPQWAGSCWYYLRYLDPRNPVQLCDSAKAAYWLPVDLYVGGAEHAVLHLLYSRFWHKVLSDRGHVPGAEPFKRLVNQGMILGETEYTGFQRARIEETIDDTGKSVQKLIPLGEWVSAKSVKFDGSVARTDDKAQTPLACVKLGDDEAQKDGDFFVLKSQPTIRIDARAYKMSKSRGNVINPDAVVREYGADSLRLFEMFMGPLEAMKPWSMRGVEGVYRFLSRVWRIYIDERTEDVRLNDTIQNVEPDRDTLRVLHRTIQRVTEDLDGMRFNTAISAMMEFSNHVMKLEVRPRSVMDPFVLLLAPFAPHLAEELWQALGHPKTLAYEPWPTFDPKLVATDTIEVPIQINGKLRHKLIVPTGIAEKDLESLALADEKVQALIAGKPVKKIITARGKLVNIVVAGA